MTCRYGITVMAEDNGELDYKCEVPATRNVACIDERVSSGLASIDLCEPHYQEFLRWDNKK